MASPKQIDQQLSIVADAVRAFRMAMDTASLDESERRQIVLQRDDDSLSLEELLGWVEDFAANQGPRLISSSDKFTRQTAIALAQHLSGFLRLAEHAPFKRASNDSWSSPPIRNALHNLQHSMLDLLHRLR